MSSELEKFEADRKAGESIAEKYYSRDAAFNAAFGEGFAVAMAAQKEVANAGTGD